MDAWVRAAGAFEDAPIEDLSAVKRLALKNLDRAKKNLKREYDPEGPLWISYTEHLDDYEGTEREAASAAALPVAPLHGGVLTMTPFGFPVLLELAGRRCVVIGALPIREGKVEALLAGGATDVLVVSTEPSDRLDGLELLEGVAGRAPDVDIGRPGRRVPGDRARPGSRRAGPAVGGRAPCGSIGQCS